MNWHCIATAIGLEVMYFAASVEYSAKHSHLAPEYRSLSRGGWFGWSFN